MGKCGYTKCVELMRLLVSQGKTSLTENEIRNEIAKHIGFDARFGVIDKYFKALLIFELLKPGEGNKYVINEEALNG